MLEILFGQRLKHYRKKMRLTQEQLAIAIDVDNRTVRRWEKGDAGPEFNKLEKIASTLNVSVADLMVVSPRIPIASQRLETHRKFRESQARFQESRRKFLVLAEHW